ncbi:Na+/H+ antiporter NhaA [Gammaproteobacteria bacterium LSUCC0112]|nr:Na+/H+ antiporter NhaA [Gammaproteobacteria bacterium LSUCC0112]
MIEKPNSAIGQFLKLESAGGILLMVSALLAIVVANSSLAPFYDIFVELPLQVRIGALDVSKPLLLWINDGLMAIFFFLVGMELKREVLEGELSDRRKVILPCLGAVGGMAAPAVVYLLINNGDATATSGWAIPAATDIAFALGILTLLGSRVPVTLKVFLTSLAIFDDLGAIVIIAIFYTDQVSLNALMVAAVCVVVLALLNRSGVSARSIYRFVGIMMWVSMLKSGVHATLTGVVLAFFIPMRDVNNSSFSPLKDWEHDLHQLVAFMILPVFAFANAGLDLRGVGVQQLTHGVPLGIAAGLFFGKQIGIFGICWMAIKCKLTDMPQGMSWLSLYGASILCGVGFTMSLFIGSLAFEQTGVNRLFDERLGILLGSLLSGVVGYLVLRKSLRLQS